MLLYLNLLITGLKRKQTSTNNAAICQLCFLHNLAFAVNTSQDISLIESLCSQKDPVHVMVNYLCSSPDDPSVIDKECVSCECL